MPYCPGCGGAVTSDHHFCGNCGRALLPGSAPAPAEDLFRTPGGLSSGMAVAALILNIIVWPGLGSLIGGRQIGWIQGFLHLAGLLLVLSGPGIVLGIPLMVAMWIWGIVTGVQLINVASGRS